jgi:hypothetical protein
MPPRTGYPLSRVFVVAMVSLLVPFATNRAFAQTHPAAQSLPYAQSFASVAHTDIAYPAGWQGWQISTSPGSAFDTAGPSADKTLTPLSDASITVNGAHNYDGKLGFLNSASSDNTLALALNTTGAAGVTLRYAIMTIRNPYDGGSNTRINEVVPQYRVGTTGSWTNLAALALEYQNDPITQTGIGVTTPQKLETRAIALPPAAVGQPVVELRWAQRQVSGAGSRPSFALDDVRATLATSITIAAPPSSTCGSFVTLQATVTPAGATGTVEFVDGSTVIATGTLDGSGNAYAVVQFSSAGTHPLAAAYLGDSGYDRSESAPLAHPVGPRATTTSLSAPAKNTCGDKLLLEATVSPVAEGEITFYDGSTDLGVATVDEFGHAVFSVVHGLAKGTHSLTAAFAPSGDCAQGSTSAAVTHEVNPVPSTLALAAPESLACGSKLTLTATVTPASPGTVTFYDGASSIATAAVASGVATASLPSGLAVGTHSLSASYSPSATCAGPSTSSPVSHVVSRIRTTLTLQAPTQGVCGQSFSLTASHDPVTPGIVRFFDGAALLGSASLNGFGSASFLVSGGLSSGTHVLHATCAGNVCADSSASEDDTLVVQPASTSLVLSSNRNPSSAGDMVAISARITPSSAQGTVELFDGATSLGTATFTPLAGGMINFNPTFTGGDHVLTATFTDGGCWSGSTSPAFVQHVVTPTISISDASVVEGDQSSGRGVLFTVTMTAPLMNHFVTLHGKTFDGSAFAGDDYRSFDQDFVISAGQTSTTIFVSVIGDRIPEPNENFTVVLSHPDHGSLTDSVAVGTIVDDDVAVLVIQNASIAEGNVGQSTMTFTATLSKPIEVYSNVDWHTEDAGATIANGDYQAASGRLSFAPFDSVETFSVLVNGDSTFEQNESFQIVLENPVNLVPTANPVGIIQNDDGAPQIVVDDASLTEGDAGHVFVEIHVRLLTPSFEPVRVNYETLDGTATANDDYLTTSGVLTVDPKTSETSVFVRVFGDELCEYPDETFSLRIFGPHGGVIARNTATITIVDQDCVAGVGTMEPLPLLDLAPIRPNPARGAVRLNYAVGRAGPLRVSILDVQGREVATIVDRELEPGRYEATWTGRGDRGPVAAGLYFVKLNANGKTITKRFAYAR